MIITQLRGGLGNQMFEYAAGLSLSWRHQVPVKLDLSYLQDRSPRENFTFRNFELGIFQLQYQQSSQEDIDKFIKSKRSIKSYLRYKAAHFFSQSQILDEASLNYDPRFEEASDSCYLRGYWANELYFKKYETLVRAHFRFRNPPAIVLNTLIRNIQTSNSISVHLRRGDYANNDHIQNYHGLCSLGYYNSAVQFISSKISTPHLFIFSDDMEWVENNWQPDCSHTYVRHETGVLPFEDMRLMSFCKHHIIANSTYSWWGAWLNESKEKIVVGPKKWINDSDRNINDVLPHEWIKI